MIRIIKKSLIIFLIVTIDVTIYITKIIYNFFEENKSKIKKYSKSFYSILKEELER